MPGDNYFYLKRGKTERQFKLMTRHRLHGAEKLLVDPDRQAKRTGVPHAINYFMPSWDGRYVAYGMSAGGSEDASLYVLDVRTARHVGTPVPRVQEAGAHWLPDSRSLTFTQLKALQPGDPESDFYKDSQVLWLRLQGHTSITLPVFGMRATPTLGLERLDVAELIFTPGSPWMIARTSDTTVPEGKLFVAPLAQLGHANVAWRQISQASDKITAVQLKGHQLYLRTHAGAPRSKVLALDLRAAMLARAEEVVSEPKDGVLEGFHVTRTGIVTEVREGTSIALRRHAAGDKVGQRIELPFAGAASVFDEPAHSTDEVLYTLAGWADLPRIYLLRGTRSVDAGLKINAALPTLPALQVSEVKVPSHDGVLVPMTILHRRGLALNGQNPVLLDGYAAYGFSETAFFSPANMTWIERGGVLAFINARGSGVYGDDWYRAGFKQTKPNTWKDGIAGARYLIAQGYGSPATMGVTGGSAGGVFAGRAATAAPELFAAAVLQVGVLDAVRAEESANGATNTSEFGSTRDASEFGALLEMSTYHAIKNGTPYPAMLLVHGMNDPRVDVWHSAKTAARLQAANPAHKPALLRLDMQAGHGVGSTTTQRYAMAADMYAFLLWQMGKAGLKN
jgi:prolyl oligopeptidase